MAANGVDSFDSKPFDDITTCCICTEVYTDLIVLPCSHIFCMKCFQENGVKSYKGQGDELPCPICRRMFKLPTEEFHALPQNLFIERQIQVATLPDQSVSSIPICDTCSEEIADNAYCVDCRQQFCLECSKHHMRCKLTKNHCLLPINDREGGKLVEIDQAPGTCELHKLHILNIYCTDCKTVVCAMCFIDDHGNHKGSHVNKVVAGFRKQIENNTERINECRSKTETRKAELEKMKADLQERVKIFECEVHSRKVELKQFIDEHATSLLQGVYSIMQSKLQEIQIATEGIDTYLASLVTYNSNYQKIICKGSAQDICCAFSDLAARAVDLQQQYEQMIEREINSFNFCFKKSEKFVEENCDNVIGGIEDEGEPKARKEMNQSLLSQKSNEIERLRKEMQCEIANRESLRLVIVQLRMNMHKEAQASHRAFTEELTEYKAHIKKLIETLDNKKIICSTLQAENNQLKQKLDATAATNKSLKDQNDKLKQELEAAKEDNSFVQADDNGFVQEVNDTHERPIRPLEAEVKKLEQELQTTNLAEHSYKSVPVLIQTIRPNATDTRKKLTSGMAILDNEFFVVSDQVSEVDVYDLMSLRFKCRWHLKELINPRDIVSCSRNKCLYIFNDFGIRKSKQILGVDPNGNVIKNWSTGPDWGWSLSVTYDSNIILSLYRKQYLKEYSPDGVLIRNIRISLDSGVCIWHAVKLTSGHFMVSLGLRQGFGDVKHSVCTVNGDGKIVKTVGAGGTMRRVVHLAVDGNGFVMVADRVNGRVLLFDSDLQLKREILSRVTHGLQYPWRILLDESNGRLLVVVTNTIPGVGEILIFDLKLKI